MNSLPGRNLWNSPKLGLELCALARLSDTVGWWFDSYEEGERYAHKRRQAVGNTRGDDGGRVAGPICPGASRGNTRCQQDLAGKAHYLGLASVGRGRPLCASAPASGRIGPRRRFAFVAPSTETNGSESFEFRSEKCKGQRDCRTSP